MIGAIRRYDKAHRKILHSLNENGHMFCDREDYAEAA